MDSRNTKIHVRSVDAGQVQKKFNKVKKYPSFTDITLQKHSWVESCHPSYIRMEINQM